MNAKIVKFKPGTNIFIDSSPFIYLLEGYSKQISFLESLFNDITGGRFQAKTSVITTAEVLTKPYQKQDNFLINKFIQIFTLMPNLEIVYPTYATSIVTAQIRAKYGFRLADSFQLALAQEYHCESFLTNDKQLHRYDQLKVVCLD